MTARISARPPASPTSSLPDHRCCPLSSAMRSRPEPHRPPDGTAGATDRNTWSPGAPCTTAGERAVRCGGPAATRGGGRPRALAGCRPQRFDVRARRWPGCLAANGSALKGGHACSGCGRQLGKLGVGGARGSAASIVHQPVELAPKAQCGPVVAGGYGARVAAPEELNDRLLWRPAHVSPTFHQQPSIAGLHSGVAIRPVDAAELCPPCRVRGQSGTGLVKKELARSLRFTGGCSTADCRRSAECHDCIARGTARPNVRWSR